MQETINHVKEKMEKTIDVLDNDLKAIRAGRANPAVLDKITIDYYGSETKINTLAAIQVTEARMLVIQPFDNSILKDIERAINTSDIGINPQNDGKVIRLTFPELTEEHRKNLAKDIAKMGENSKVAIRNTRRDGIDKLKKMQKANEITEDDLKDAEKKIQDLHDKYIEQIEKLVKDKEKEVTSI